MKYCTKCGHELLDEAVVCPKCGCAVEGAKNPVTAGNPSGLKTVANVFMIIGCIVGAMAFLIPLAWCLPMTISYNRKIKQGEPVSVGFKVCCLLFVNVMPAKNKTKLAKTPQFPRFLSNSRLKYGKYVCVRLCQKSSKISAFWLRASLTASF